MNKKRIITGSILILLALGLLFGLDTPTFVLATTLIVLLAGWEWSKLAGLEKTISRVGFLALLLLCMWIIDFSVPVISLLLCAMMFWLYALYLICRFPAGTHQWSSKTVRVIMGLFVLLPCWLSINFIHATARGPWTLLFMFVLVWSADIGAYFAGRRFGKNKLMPLVSPGKTWEGFFGGLILSLIVAMFGVVFLSVHKIYWPIIFPMVIILNVFAVVGDLFESMLKRHVNLKDSGNILPGHGGILDRLDSLMAAAPLFLLGMLLHWY